MNVPTRSIRLVPILLFAAATAACGFRFMDRQAVTELSTDDTPQEVESPVRVFMLDGSAVVFEGGALVGSDAVTGRSRDAGIVYDLARTRVGSRVSVPLDSVVGLEALSQSVEWGSTVAVSTVSVAASAVATAALLKALFGSCPTIYSDTADGERLDAEAFSYSISPLLESRDVDRVSAQPDATGRLELEVRNEALETHYINHIELLEVRHARDRIAVTGVDNTILSLGPVQPVDDVTDRAGRDVSDVLAEVDDLHLGSSPTRMAAVTPDDYTDWVEFTLPPTDADSVALGVTARNSLLTTVLFYDFMLGMQGAAALDWVGRDIEQIGTAVEVGGWVNRLMGLRVQVERDGEFETVARLGDPGPIAWTQAAILVPVSPSGPTRVRIAYMADQWRLDQVTWTASVERPDVITHRVADLTPGGAANSAALLERVGAPDDAYLVTTAGTYFGLGFDVGVDEADARPGARTFFFSSQGYYTEWIRPEWVRSVESPQPFRPADALIPDLMARWLEVGPEMEARFHASRIPVR